MALWWSRSNWGADLLALRLVRPVSAVTAGGPDRRGIGSRSRTRRRTLLSGVLFFPVRSCALPLGCQSLRSSVEKKDEGGIAARSLRSTPASATLTLSICAHVRRSTDSYRMTKCVFPNQPIVPTMIEP
jgi:hypothetical protein